MGKSKKIRGKKTQKKAAPKNAKVMLNREEVYYLRATTFSFCLNKVNTTETTVPINPPNMKIVSDPPTSYMWLEMICLLSSYKTPPIKMKNMISRGPALPTTEANAIVIVKAILNAPVAVKPRVFQTVFPSGPSYMPISERYIMKSSPHFCPAMAAPFGSCFVFCTPALVQNALIKK